MFVLSVCKGEALRIPQVAKVVPVWKSLGTAALHILVVLRYFQLNFSAINHHIVFILILLGL